jgi:hypothetical protein
MSLSACATFSFLFALADNLEFLELNSASTVFTSRASIVFSAELPAQGIKQALKACLISSFPSCQLQGSLADGNLFFILPSFPWSPWPSSVRHLCVRCCQFLVDTLRKSELKDNCVTSAKTFLTACTSSAGEV